MCCPMSGFGVLGEGRFGSPLRNEPTGVALPDRAEPKPLGVMLDPSAFLRPGNEFARRLERVPESNTLQLMTPVGAFAALEAVNESSTLRSLGGISAETLDPSRVLQAIQLAGVAPYQRPDWAAHEFEEILRAIHSVESDPVVADIRFDEWFYLTHSSTVVSRLKAPFRQLARIGTLVVELATPLGDRIARRTLKLDGLEPVTRAQRLRALGKWTAVGGETAATLIAPWMAAAVVASAGTFVLLDP